MARPKSLKPTLVVSTRIEEDMYEKLKAIAALETHNTGRVVSTQDLHRRALDFVYGDNEHMRECFRRARIRNKLFKK